MKSADEANVVMLRETVIRIYVLTKMNPIVNIELTWSFVCNFNSEHVTIFNDV